MSATHRSSTTRIAHDNYPTPSWCVRRLLEACPLPGGVWLEPCAGEGAIIEAVAQKQHDDHREQPSWAACEIRDVTPHVRAFRWVTGSYLDTDFSGADVIITNPPFSLAFEVMQKAVREAPVVALLLRLNLLGSGRKSGRSAWLREHTPDVYVLPDRPSFTGHGTDAAEYAWFVWGGVGGQLQILTETPLSERRAG